MYEYEYVDDVNGQCMFIDSNIVISLYYYYIVITDQSRIILCCVC